MRDIPAPLALLWDKSHLWGVLLVRALHTLGSRISVLKAEQIQAGALAEQAPKILLVPGGWARLKSLALNESGRSAIRTFVAQGGTYLGICGGAGLALASEARTPFLDLCTWSRKPAHKRLPNFSGHLQCSAKDQDRDIRIELPVWWPSQFAPDPDAPLEILASYEMPAKDFWSADLHWAAVPPGESRYWEDIYGINLNPNLLRGEPCIVRGTYGQGKYILSYAHLETPDSPQANTLLANLLALEERPIPAWDLAQDAPIWTDPHLEQMQADLKDLIRLGQNHFLLQWRTPWLLGWRRGVPGSSISFLYAMTWQARHGKGSGPARAYWDMHGQRCQWLCVDFCTQVRTYLVHERRALSTSPSSPEASASPAIQRHKVELFGKFPGYGGLYGQILEILDELLWLQFSAPASAPAQP